MKIKVLLCNCKGLCDSFKNTDMNTLPFQVESDLDVRYTFVHPQLCGQGGNEILAEVLRESVSDPEAYVMVGACAPDAQMKLFKKLLRNSGLDEKRFVPLDIRGTDNDGILARLKEKVEALLKQQEQAPVETPAS